MLALTVMQKSPGVRIEDGLSQHQCEQKKLCILQPSEWGGESEVRLLVIGIGRENCCHHWIRGFIHMCMKISMSPSSSSKMRGGIFIPIDITELLSQWKQYKPSPLLIVYNGSL